MAEHGDAGVDPRFDPQFQRGYDPKLHRTPRRTPVVEPVETPAVIPPAGVTTAEHPVVSTSSTTEADEVSPPRRNPFRLILLLASIVAIVAAGLLLWRRIEEDPNGFTVGPEIWETFTRQLEDALLVPLLTGGLLGLCLWLAIGALRNRDDA